MKKEEQINMKAMKKKIARLIRDLEKEIKVIKAEQGIRPDEDWQWEPGNMEDFSRGWARGAQAAIGDLKELLI